MHFLISVIDDTSGSATGGEAAAIDSFNDALRAGGHWVVAGGIAAPAEAAVIDARGGEPEVRPGPLHDTREYVAGFWVIGAPDRDAALALATRASRACSRRVELRPLLGLAD
ncbi:YciI family protein [Yonghaparkia sp. Soil809]|uniref:YciI family protein n=1 Tax=Yonghaparkia sp. Soil809 TaxID=1736417 RepID=UPI0006F1E60E|nr:YciI family protein [Yonghaparkia sp. Soil809]KRF31394.1 hypothetical protein ASG83_11500 [Yonghaparkia sp. Soil809]